jgi:hypothetical protein
MLKDIRKSTTQKTTISSDGHKLSISMGADLTHERKAVSMDIIDEILEDLKNKKFKGTLSFQGDTVEIALESGSEKKTWTREV